VRRGLSDEPFYFDIEPLIGQAERLPALADIAFLNTLVASGITPSQLKSCPECQSIFLLERKPRPDKQFHCSTRCAQLAATIRYRKKKEAELKEKERERSHNRYVAKQRRKHPHAKIPRRPRK
jgi:hypothetical protein